MTIAAVVANAATPIKKRSRSQSQPSKANLDSTPHYNPPSASFNSTSPIALVKESLSSFTDAIRSPINSLTSMFTHSSYSTITPENMAAPPLHFNAMHSGSTHPVPPSRSAPPTHATSATNLLHPNFSCNSTTTIISPTMSPSSTPTSPLSELSRSPSPPQELPLHRLSYGSDLDLSSNSSSRASLSPDSSQVFESDVGDRPTKRRRITEDPELREKYLDLTSEAIQDDQKDNLHKLMRLIKNRRKIVVIAGAGISVSAGIPDFRSSKGLFKSLKKEHNLKSSGKDLFDASVYKDADSTSSFHQMVRQLSDMTKNAKPTAFHQLLSKLSEQDRLLRLYTQNVDGLDSEMESLRTTVPLNRKGPWPKTIQLHGGLQKMVCSKCNDLTDLQPDLFDGPTPPECEPCKATDNARTEYAGKRSHGIGRLRPRMVLYNEHNPDDEAIGAVVKSDLRTRPDALIVVGTTLKIPGVKRIVREMTQVIHGRKDGLVVWMNFDDPPPSKDYEWDIIVRGPCDRVADEASYHIWDRPEVSSELGPDSQSLLSSSQITAPISWPTPASSRSSSLLPLLSKKKTKELKSKEPKSKEPKSKEPKIKTIKPKLSNIPKAPKPEKRASGTSKAKKAPKSLKVPGIGQLAFALGKNLAAHSIKSESQPSTKSLLPLTLSEKENSDILVDDTDQVKLESTGNEQSHLPLSPPASDTSTEKARIDYVLN